MATPLSVLPASVLIDQRDPLPGCGAQAHWPFAAPVGGYSPSYARVRARCLRDARRLRRRSCPRVRAPAVLRQRRQRRNGSLGSAGLTRTRTSTAHTPYGLAATELRFSSATSGRSSASWDTLSAIQATVGLAAGQREGQLDHAVRHPPLHGQVGGYPDRHSRGRRPAGCEQPDAPPQRLATRAPCWSRDGPSRFSAGSPFVSRRLTFARRSRRCPGRRRCTW